MICSISGCALIERPAARADIAQPDGRTRRLSAKWPTIVSGISPVAAVRRSRRSSAAGLDARALRHLLVGDAARPAVRLPAAPDTDRRGTFVEFLRTRDERPDLVFTAHPGMTRGGHYHHTKVEKFARRSGQARFRFRHVAERRDIRVTGQARRADGHRDDSGLGARHHQRRRRRIDRPRSGRARIFDPARPDTVAMPL